MQKNKIVRYDQDYLKKFWTEWLFHHPATHFVEIIGLRSSVFEFNECNHHLTFERHHIRFLLLIEYWQNINDWRSSINSLDWVSQYSAEFPMNGHSDGQERKIKSTDVDLFPFKSFTFYLSNLCRVSCIMQVLKNLAIKLILLFISQNFFVAQYGSGKDRSF